MSINYILMVIIKLVILSVFQYCAVEILYKKYGVGLKAKNEPLKFIYQSIWVISGFVIWNM